MPDHDVPIFGDLVRQARLAAGMTQQELAERAGLSVRGISDLERGLVRAPRRDTLALLVEALALPDAERRRWEELRRHRARQPPAPSVEVLSASLTSGQLPVPLTSLIGREREQDELAALLSQPELRLLTLTGPGGVGKTRLAIAVCERARVHFADGVRFVPLAPLVDPRFVIPAIATVLGVAEGADTSLIERLIKQIGKRQLLLCLDNVEHVSEAAEQVAGLLADCPHLTILATGRVPLHLSAEREYPVAPLALSGNAVAQPLEDDIAPEAAILFAVRARAVQPLFALTAETAPVVAAICHKLDGLPLAIELAAVRLRMFSLEELSTRLEAPLGVLGGGPRDAPDRQRTMRDAIAWSYDLLAEDKRWLFRSLSVCRGGWSLDAAANLVDDRHDVIDGLSTLLEHNLVRQLGHRGHRTRFGMLETIRQYGLEQLSAWGERDTAQRWHAHYYLSWAEQRGPALFTWDMARVMNEFRHELDNLRAALSWIVTGEDPERALLDAAAKASALMWVVWRSQGLMSEGRQWLELALSKRQLSLQARLYALNGAGFLAAEQGDFDQARAWHDEALAIALEHDDSDARLGALWGLGRVTMWEADLERTVDIHAHGVALARELGDDLQASSFLANAALPVASLGDLARGGQMLHEALSIDRELSGNSEAPILMDLACLALMEDQLNEARAFIQEALAIECERGISRIVANCLEVCAALAVLEQQPARAANLYGAVASLRERLGAPVKPYDLQLYYDPYLDQGKAQLSEQAWNAAWSEGRIMPLNDALDVAQQCDATPGSASSQADVSKAATGTALSQRELEVLRLLVDGQTNQEIADALYISPHTVANHVANIMNKFGVDSRTAAATWGLRRGLV